MKKLRLLIGATSVCAVLTAFGAVTDPLEAGFQNAPEFPPRVQAGVDRDVMLDGKTYLSGSAIFLKPDSSAKVVWSKVSGPGKVIFENAQTNVTTATFSKPGEYVLQLMACEGKLRASSTLKVKVIAPPPAKRLEVVYTKPYKICLLYTSPSPRD